MPPHTTGTPSGPGSTDAVSILRSLFSRDFTSTLTPTAAGTIHLLVIVVALGYWAVSTVALLTTGTGAGSLPGVTSLLLGWIPALLAVAASRVGLEFVTRTLATADDTRAIRERLERVEADETGSPDDDPSPGDEPDEHEPADGRV